MYEDNERKRTLHGLPQCLRWTMFALNILLFITSTLTLGYAAYLLSSKWNLLSSDNHIPVIMFILFAILLIVSCLGSIATCRLSRPLLIAYSLILMACFILQIVVIVLILTSKISTESWLEDRWLELSTDDISLIQSQLKCCGFNENTDTESSCDQYAGTYCEDKMEDYLKKLQIIGVILGALILIFEIGGAVVSCVLIQSLKEQIEKVRNDSYVEYSYMEDPKQGGYPHYRL